MMRAYDVPATNQLNDALHLANNDYAFHCYLCCLVWFHMIVAGNSIH